MTRSSVATVAATKPSPWLLVIRSERTNRDRITVEIG